MRPSSLSRIRDEWTAYQFDAAVLQFGRDIEARIASNKETVESIIAAAEAALLAGPDGTLSADIPAPIAGSGGFASLKGFVTRKVKSIEDWMNGRE